MNLRGRVAAFLKRLLPIVPGLLVVASGCALPTDASDRIPTTLVVAVEDVISASSLGETIQFEPRVLDQRGLEIHNVPLIWTVGDPTVLSPTSPGRFVTTGNGSTRIHVRVDPEYPGVNRLGYRAGIVESEVTVTVQQRAAALRITPEERTLWARGQQWPLTPVVVDANGSEIEGTTVTWASSDEQIAAVDENGVVTAGKDGRVEISASANGMTAVAVVIVKATTRYSICVTSREISAPSCATGGLSIWSGE